MKIKEQIFKLNYSLSVCSLIPKKSSAQSVQYANNIFKKSSALFGLKYSEMVE